MTEPVLDWKPDADFAQLVGMARTLMPDLTDADRERLLDYYQSWLWSRDYVP